MCKADFKVKKESKERDENWFIEAKQEENEIRSLQQCVRCWNALLSVVLFNCEYKTMISKTSMYLFKLIGSPVENNFICRMIVVLNGFIFM